MLSHNVEFFTNRLAAGRFFDTVELVHRLEAEGRGGRQGRLAEYLTRLDFVIFDELGYLPSAQAGGQLLSALRNHQSQMAIAP